MKKRGLVVILLLVMMVSSVALAERTHFNLEIPTGTGTPLMDWAPVTQPCSHIYVWLGLNGTNTKYGGKWTQPDTAVYITSASLRGARTYRVSIALNSSYGLESMRISGYAEPQP